MEILVGTGTGVVETLLAEPVPVGSQCFCFTQRTKADGHAGKVQAICQRGRLFATGGSDGWITVAALEAAEYERAWKQDLPAEDPVTCMDISQGGKFCFVGTQAGHIYIIHLQSMRLVKVLEKAHRGPVLALRVHPERFTVFSVGVDRNLSAWNPAPDRILHMEHDQSPTRMIEFSPNGVNLALVSTTATNVINSDSGRRLHRNNFESRTVAVGWLSEARLCVGTEDGCLSFIDTTANSVTEIPAVYPAKLTAMAIDRSRQFMATADSSWEIMLWRIEGGDRFIWPLCFTTVDSAPLCVTLATDEELGLHRTMRQELEKEGFVFSDWD
ncbi:p21-activated protein kinase-interacting protein 1-like [Culex quinquefasciatus]|uniref:p21-activated protein kinase-interacting protein 1-like n=1 Tax=Culex quinquefasciatus TaxID=7176 RepID=UPI0018E2F941|nr:p21-activated protein kinase-interacting protein 1-like [Culex quinquefasciatus]